MPCYCPMKGWLRREVNPATGKRGVTFTYNDGYHDKPMQVPCGTCIGCRLDKASEWASRCEHEAANHANNCFVTLTYDNDRLPPDGSLRPEDFVLFMKRLRKRFEPQRIRFFQCGEYGAQLQRPHHHAILFGVWFPDSRRVHHRSRYPMWESTILNDLWGHGFCSVQEANARTAGYTARYSLKKVLGDHAAVHYGNRRQEYLTMSRRPGIGSDYIDRYGEAILNSDKVFANGKLAPVPRFYRDRLATKGQRQLEQLERLKLKRLVKAKASPDNTPPRLDARETCAEAKVNHYSARDNL